MKQLKLFEDNLSGATFSDCHKYRFILWRIWDIYKPKIMFIGLNPSKANEDSNDPTIRRVKKLSQSWGFGGFYMLNLFTFITPNPKELFKCSDPLKLSNWYITNYLEKAEKVVFAWGNFKEAENRAKEVIELCKEHNVFCLKKNKNGSPMHPLFCPKNCTLIKT
jgi:hypothetical protein